MKGGRGNSFVLNMCSFNNIEKFFSFLSSLTWVFFFSLNCVLFCFFLTWVVLKTSQRLSFWVVIFLNMYMSVTVIYLTFPSFLQHAQLVAAGWMKNWEFSQSYFVFSPRNTWFGPLNLNPYLGFPVPIIKLKLLKCFNLDFIERIIYISFNSFNKD